MNDAYIESLVFAVLMIVFFGVHTTSNAAFDVLSRLVLHNEYIDELRQEQEEIYAEQPDAEFVHALSKKMVKLDSFIRESSRFRMTSLSLPHTYVGKEEVHLPAGEVIQPGIGGFIRVLSTSKHIYIFRRRSLVKYVAGAHASLY
jgi:cytochrome P450